jgi:pimeloyl-ACP methyl ester carboxylesterase
MTQERIHRVVADDGTELAGRVHGSGSPLVLMHGAFETGDTCWAELVPRLSGRYRCYTFDQRGHGRSGYSLDQSIDRLVRDATTFIESVGEPVGVVAESGGAHVALGAAAATDSVAAMACIEPALTELQSEEEAARFDGVVARVARLADEGRDEDAIWAFAELIGNEEELAAVRASGAASDLAPQVKVQVEEFKQLRRAGPQPSDPESLAAIDAPVMLLLGTSTALLPWFSRAVRHVSEHARDARVVEIEGAGHFGTALAAEAIAEKLEHFFGQTLA